MKQHLVHLLELARARLAHESGSRGPALSQLIHDAEQVLAQIPGSGTLPLELFSEYCRVVVRLDRQLFDRTDDAPPRVFISHSSLDRQFVEGELLSALRGHGVATWHSAEDIQTAEEWERSIR